MLSSLIDTLTPSINWPSQVDISVDIDIHISR